MLSALSLPLLEEMPIKTHPLCLLFLLRMLQELSRRKKSCWNCSMLRKQHKKKVPRLPQQESLSVFNAMHC
jgi:hypothetical protein